MADNKSKFVRRVIDTFLSGFTVIVHKAVIRANAYNAPSYKCKFEQTLFVSAYSRIIFSSITQLLRSQSRSIFGALKFQIFSYSGIYYLF